MINMFNKYVGAKKSSFNTRFFVETDKNSYVVAMFVACTAIEAEQCESAKLTEVSAKVYESIGANSQYVNGEVVQGEPRIVPLTQETMRKVLSSKMAEATARIQILQDAIDFGESTGDEKESIIGWKKYRIALSRIDLSAAPNIYWPSEP